MTDATDDASVLDDVLLGETHGEGDDSSHLEIDDFQTKEIRQIFLTTLPDYLEPVRQMVAQLFEGGDGQEEILRTLDTTLSSIGAAASRVEIDDACSAVQRVRDQLSRFGEGSESELREGIQSALSEIEEIASVVSGQLESVRAGGPAQTIVAAFNDIEGIDRSALQRLTAAGLVTVQQIRMADPDEIVAVTGLAPTVVDAIVAALAGGEARPEPPASDHVVPSASADPFETELARQLRAQVDTEVRLDEVRGDILGLRVSMAALRDELAAVEQRCNEVRDQLAHTRNDIAERLAALSSGRAQRARLERRKPDLENAVARAERRVAELRSERVTVDDAHNDFARAIGGLVSKVERMVQAASNAGYEVSGPAARGSEGWNGRARH